MKIINNLILIASFSLVYSLSLHASINIVGNDTIYYANERYFMIYQADTFYVDTSLIFLKYNDVASAIDIESLENAYNLTLNHSFTFDWISYTYDQGTKFIDLASDLDGENLVEAIEYNTSVYPACEPLEASDDDSYQQWYLSQIDVGNAWNITTGDPDVIVAILDWGFDWKHSDLGPGADGYENIYLNDLDPWTIWDDPTSGDTFDNDNNGYKNDYKGWGEMHDVNHYPVFYQGNDVRNYDYDWLLREITGYDVPLAYAYWMHGTFISGIIGAKTNNSHGISGIAGGWNNKGVSMLFYKLGVSGESGSSVHDIAEGIEYAVDKLPNGKKAKVIEMALGTGENQLLTNALEHAYYDKGAFIVAAAGNHAEGGDHNVSYPANLDFVFAVGATTEQDLRKSNSNYGDELDLGAPGQDIYGLVPQLSTTDGFENIEHGNTSAASAMVAGTAALMCSVNPDLTNQAIGDTLKAAADKGNYYSYDGGHNDEIGHGRLNAYKAVCRAGQSAPALEIEADETWDYPRSFLRSVHVKYGVTLTINDEIQFGPEAALVIEFGGTVILNNATLTNMKCCDYENSMWPGIEVWGHSWYPQTYQPGITYHQGVIILNGATIENAITAINLWKPDDYTMTGGIMEASNSTFKNNVCSVHALYYRNFNPFYPTNELDYYGIFTNCSFIIDTHYLGEMTFYKHVDLCSVRGLQFNGCSFSLNHAAPNVSTWNLGIAAYNAGFYVRPYCSSHTEPCEDADSCRFSGFYWGIGSFTSDAMPHPTFINSTRFDDNAIGIYLSGALYPLVLGNYFEVGYDDGTTGNCGFANGIGIDVNLANGFCIENNKLRKNFQAPPGIYAGIRVQNCPSAHDIIYKNELDRLSFGNYAEGTNRATSGNDATGVEYRCNFNDGNAVDFIVKNLGQYEGMIRGNQGAGQPADTACGNFFSPGASCHIWNDGWQTINWFYNENEKLEMPTLLHQNPPLIYINPTPVSNQNDCPDHYGGNIHLRLNQEERQLKEIDFAENLADYYSVQALYESLIDGGNTASELADIQFAEPEDMWTLRSQLLGHSPHLSQEVLRAASERTDVFPDDVLLDILSANPDELDKDTLLSYLEQKENPLPGYMLEILRQVANGVTYKTILQEELASYYAAKTQAAQDIIRSILYDSVFYVDDYRSWLDNLGGLEADKQIIAAYLYENDTSSALELLDLIPDLYNLEGQDLDEFNDYRSLIELQIEWKTEEKSVLQLDSLDLGLLEDYAVNESSQAGNIARNILEYVNYQHYCNCLQNTDSSYYKNALVHPVYKPGNQDGIFVSVEPNPAKTWIAINYELPNEESTGMLSISDISGRMIRQMNVSGRIGQKVIDTSSLRSGIYYYSLSSSGITKSGKFILQ